MNIWKIVELLIGIIVLPRLITFLGVFIFAYFGFSVSVALIANIIFSVLLIVILFKYRRVLSIGLLIGTVINVFLGYLQII